MKLQLQLENFALLNFLTLSQDLNSFSLKCSLFLKFHCFLFSLLSPSDTEVYHDALRPISMEDFSNAFGRMRDSKVHAGLKVKPSVPPLD